MSKQQANRGSFSSSIGFILAAAGSAIGLGNLWKFPYVAGNSGGGFFIIAYFLFALILGVPVMLSEMVIGRNTNLNAIGAFQRLNKKWTFVGAIGVIGAFLILSYYSIVGGWVLKYIFSYLIGADFGADKVAYFNNFVASPVEPVIFHLLFLGLTACVVTLGVSGGIEKASKFMLPALFILLIGLVIRSLTLPNAIEGVKFLFVPNTEVFKDASTTSNMLLSAMGQIFFSLSLGMGIMVTYGSYIKKDSNLTTNTFFIIGLDTLMALLSGLVILPAVFSFGYEPAAGPGLIFSIIPAIFEIMPFGSIFGLLFFTLVFLAAITSSMSLLEVVSAYFIDTYKWNRKKVTFILAIAMGIVGIFASLSMGPLSHVTIGGLNIFDTLGFITDKLLMPIGAFCTTIFVGYIWGLNNVKAEVELNGMKFYFYRAYSILIRYIAPVLIFIIFVMGLFA